MNLTFVPKDGYKVLFPTSPVKLKKVGGLDGKLPWKTPFIPLHVHDDKNYLGLEKYQI